VEACLGISALVTGPIVSAARRARLVNGLPANQEPTTVATATAIATFTQSGERAVVQHLAPSPRESAGACRSLGRPEAGNTRHVGPRRMCSRASRHCHLSTRSQNAAVALSPEARHEVLTRLGFG